MLTKLKHKASFLLKSHPRLERLVGWACRKYPRVPDVLPPDAVLLYLMGKVGSVTMYRTLTAFCPDLVVLRAHYLSDPYSSCMPPPEAQPPAWTKLVAMEREQGRLIKRALEARIGLLKSEPSLPKLRIVTAVREPLGLALSSVFEHVDLFFPHLGGEGLLRELQALLLSLEDPEGGEWRTRYVREMMQSCLHWFQRELLPVTEIDVQCEPFRVSRGYQTYESRFARCLLVRQENLDVLPPVLSEFLGRPIERLLPGNVGAEKKYSRDYAAAKKQIRFGPRFAEMCYSEGYFPVFYSQDEKEKLFRRWTKGKPAN